MDIAGSKASLRASWTYGGEVFRIKVERWRYNAEIDKNRSRTTDGDGVKRTVMCGKASGVLEIEGYFDPDSNIYYLGADADTGEYPQLFNLRLYIDGDDGTMGGVMFWDYDDENPGTQVSDFDLTGETTEGGMQRFRATFDAQFGSGFPADGF